MKSQQNPEKVVVLGTGGTIAGVATDPRDNLAYDAARLGVAELLQALPSLAHRLGPVQLSHEQVAQVDSKDMDVALWQKLARRVDFHLARPQVRSVIITHGTDTLEETAFFLHKALPASRLQGKAVVMTCAMRPASSQSPDGPQNLLDAVTVALHHDARGVVVVCAGQVHAAQDVQKVHPYRLDAFDSGDCGLLAWVEEGHLRVVRPWPQAAPDQTVKRLQRVLRLGQWPRVEVLMNYAGAGDTLARSVLAAVPGLARVRGLVLAGTGNATMNQALERVLREAAAQGISVVRASRCAQAQAMPDGRHPWAQTSRLSPVKARIALMLDLISQP